MTFSDDENYKFDFLRHDDASMCKNRNEPIIEDDAKLKAKYNLAHIIEKVKQYLKQIDYKEAEDKIAPFYSGISTKGAKIMSQAFNSFTDIKGAFPSKEERALLAHTAPGFSVDMGELQEKLEEVENGENVLYSLIYSHIKRAGFRSEADFYNSIGMQRQIFARLRNRDKTLSKQNMLLIIAGLKVDYDDAVEILHEAGYSFKRNDMRDVIITYVLQKCPISGRGVDNINTILYKCKAKTLF